MSCDELTLQAYIDGEADAVNALRIEEHVRECAVCAERARFAKSLGPTLREHARSMQAPEALRARILAMVDEAAPGRPATAAASRPWHRDIFRLPSLQRASWFASGALAASLAAFALVPVLVPNQLPLETELVSDHLRSLVENHLIDVPSSDQHTVKPWFAGRLDVAPPVPDLTMQGFRLLGGRLDYVGDRKVGVLVYQRRQHVINVFVWADTSTRDEGPRVASRKGFNICSWHGKGLVFWAVSDLNAEELLEFEKVFRTALS